MGFTVIDDLIARRSHVPPHSEVLRMRMQTIVDAVLEYDALHFDGYQIMGCEYRLEAHDANGRHRLKGTLDRLMRNPKNGWLRWWDYKKSFTPSRGDILGNEKIEPLSNVQMVFYLELLISAGERVESAHYFSLEKCQAKPVFHVSDLADRLFGPEELHILRERLATILDAATETLATADFRHRDRWMGCQTCSNVGLCRVRFHVGQTR